MNQLNHQAMCAAPVASGIVDLVSAALGKAGSVMAVEVDDVEHLIAALHVLRPTSAEIDFLDGLLQMRCNNWAEGEVIFRRLYERSLCLPSSHGLMLNCMKSGNVFGWQDEAQLVVESQGGTELGRFARSLLVDDEVARAVEAGRRSGSFVAPDSLRELTQPDPANQADANTGSQYAAPRAQSNEDMLLAMQYMRI